MASEPPDDVEVEIWIAAPPAAVMPYLSDPEHLAQWLGPATFGQPGELFRVTINGKDTARGVVVEVIPNRRVSFTWGWENDKHGIPPGTTVVTIDLEAESGGTRVRLRHSGLQGENRVKHLQGWTGLAGRLKEAAEKG